MLIPTAEPLLSIPMASRVLYEKANPPFMETPDSVQPTPAEEPTSSPPTVTRKFLVGEIPKTLSLGQGFSVEHGYLCVEKDGPEIFIRRTEQSADLCVRSDSGLQHTQHEVTLNAEQTAALWPLTEGRRACKVTHRLQLGEVPLTLDLYEGRLNWLRIAEAEFKGRRAAESFSVPPWLYREITDIVAYRNSNLSRE